MQLNKRRLNNRALSPIFATLIILAIVTVLFVPVFIWATDLTSQTEDSWKLAGVTATERIVIEEVSLKANQPCIVYVRNIGKTAVTIDNVFISLADGSGTIYPYDSVSADKVSAVQGDLITITISVSDLVFTPQEGVAYSVNVFTTRGVSDSYQVVA